MLGRTVGIIATCALGASALLIPPGVASDAAAPGLSVAPVDPKSQTIIVPCPECAFAPEETQVESAEEDDGVFRTREGANGLLMNFTVSDDGTRLQLNGAPFYPHVYEDGQLDDGRIPLWQVPSQTDLADVVNGEVRPIPLQATMWRIQISSFTLNGGAAVSASLFFDVVNGERVTVDEVEARLLETGDGQVLIMELLRHSGPNNMVDFTPSSSSFTGRPKEDAPENKDFHPSPHHHGRPHGHKFTECNVLPEPLCRLKNTIESKIDHAMGAGKHPQFRRPCPGRKGHPNRLPSKPHLQDLDTEEGPRHNPHHGRPHHMRPHGGHHGHHGHGYHLRHHFFRGLVKGLMAILIPVMAGIAVGMTVSLLGLLAGRLVTFLWIKFARGGRRGSIRLVQEEAVMEAGEDKAMLGEEEDAPPLYEDAPAYEEIDSRREWMREA